MLLKAVVLPMTSFKNAIKGFKKCIKSNIRNTIMISALAVSMALVVPAEVNIFSFSLGGSFCDVVSATSATPSKAKVTSTKGAIIRSKPSTSGDNIGGLATSDTVDVYGEYTNSDGSVWYKIYTSGGKVGYIYSNLLTITDGTRPPVITSLDENSNSNADTNTNTDNNTNTNTAAPTTVTSDVTAVNPVSATVVNAGSAGVRVRSDASTRNDALGRIENGATVTVVGKTVGPYDQREWYQVNYTLEGVDGSGFIRSDYLSLSGELVDANTVPATDTPQENTTPDTDTKTDDTTNAESLLNYTQNEDGEWYLILGDDSISKPGRYKISEIFSVNAKNVEFNQESIKKISLYEKLIVVLAIVCVVLLFVILFITFKLRDATNQIDIAKAQARVDEKKKRSTRPATRKIEPEDDRVRHRDDRERRPRPTRRDEMSEDDMRESRRDDRNRRDDRREDKRVIRERTEIKVERPHPITPNPPKSKRLRPSPEDTMEKNRSSIKRFPEDDEDEDDYDTDFLSTAFSDEDNNDEA